MLTITDFNGNDLVVMPPANATLLAAPNIGAQFKVQVQVEENDPDLTYDFVNGTLNWHDGSSPLAYFGTGTLTIDTFKYLFPGDYFVSVTGHNYRAPLPDQVEVNYYVHVVATGQQAPPANILVGPILPKDAGFPNVNNWNFNTSTDINILESSLKMLLLTAKGERVMLPEYGTSLRQIIFQQNVQGIESLVHQEIVDAITKWEPRVQLISINVTRNQNKSVVVQAMFLSKLDQTGFTTNLTYQP
jgi:hypothetical protein